MHPSLPPASATFAGLMYSIANKMKLKTPLSFVPKEVAGVQVQPSTGRVFLCEQTLTRLSLETLAVVAAHEAGHLLECKRLWRFLLARRSVGLAAIALAVTTLGQLHLGQAIAVVAMITLGVERNVPRALVDARTEVYADAAACRYACGTGEAWLLAVEEYARVLGTPGDAALRYRRLIVPELVRNGVVTRVLTWGPEVLSDYETDEALAALGIATGDPGRSFSATSTAALQPF